MEFTIRLEQQSDYRAVENLAREAFWNIHVPGCDEHLLVHELRTKSAFIPELHFVALNIEDSQIIGNIMYAKTIIENSKGEHIDVITFGPLSVFPKFQNKGIGAALINHSAKEAAKLGYRAILIYGDPLYYERFGFKGGKHFNIRTVDGKFKNALMALELYEGALKDVSGRFIEGEAYQIDKEKLDEFDKSFPYKEKLVIKSQERFNEMVNQYED